MRDKIEEMPTITSVLGISMGDEGKGRVVHELLDLLEKEWGKPPFGVLKVNGGANAGHTAAGLKLNLLPSGVGNSRVECLLIGSGVVADPRKFIWEAKPLESRGITVMKRLRIDQRCQVSDLCHRLLDLAWENYREKVLGLENRGTTGRGISPAYCDETSQWQIFYQVFQEERSVYRYMLKSRMQRAMDTIRYVCKVSESDWRGFFETLSNSERKANQSALDEGFFSPDEFNFMPFASAEPFSLDFELLENTYWEAGMKLVDCIYDVRELMLTSVHKKKVVVAEFGQAYWLDKRHGFTPNVTASHTTGTELFNSAGIPLSKISQVGCCKAYDTKVGTHHFITKLDQIHDPWGKKLSKLEFGTSTGRQRMVGWFDSVEKGNALRYGGFDHLVINKLDALTATDSSMSHLKICTAYESPDGSFSKTVPRDEISRKMMVPFYESFPVWTEDLQKIRSYEDFPLEAKNYLSRMICSLIEVAYPEGFENVNLPQLLFIGVGPSPGQVIGNLPSTLSFIDHYKSQVLSHLS